MKWIKGYGEMLQEKYDYLKNREFFKKGGQDFLYSAMIDSINENDIEALEALIEDGLDVNHSRGYKIYGINLAVLKGRKEMVKIFLENGADPNQLDGINHFPLYIAVRMIKNHEIAKLLLEHGADPNMIKVVRPKEGSLLHNAIMDGDHKMVEILLDAGADPNESEMIPLLMINDVVTSLNTKIFKLLIDAGIDLEKKRGVNDHNILDGLMLKYSISKYRDNEKRKEAIMEAMRMAINAGGNPSTIFTSKEEMENALGPASSWYDGELSRLERRFKSTEIRRNLF